MTYWPRLIERREFYYSCNLYSSPVTYRETREHTRAAPAGRETRNRRGGARARDDG